ncbi:MAG: methyltransferase domain-containing protein [Vicinamibacteria bacterium]|nr:methyltransferase domain-containing protein [Vicinamibacteria bacterium]
MIPSTAAAVRIARGFDRLAPVYDLMADVAFAGRIHASQTLLLPHLPPVRRALVVGGGTGRFLDALLTHDPHVTAVSVDLSPRMTRRTAARLAARELSGRAELRVGGLEKLRSDERFDLVVTHCFLDLFTDADLGAVIEPLHRSLKPAGHWLFSDFAAPGNGLGGVARSSIVTALYAFFQATCSIAASRLADFDRAFERAGLQTVARRALLGGLLQTALLWRPPVIQRA